MELDLLAQAALEGRGVAVGGLPQACNTGLDRKQFSLLFIRKMLLKLISCNGARTDNRKVTVQHVQELRHLIDGALADELTDLGNAGVIVDLALDLPLMQLLRTQILLYIASVGDHAAKLKDLDGLTALADALQCLQRVSGRFKANERTNNGHWNYQHHAHTKAENKIKQPLKKTVRQRTARLHLLNG